MIQIAKMQLFLKAEKDDKQNYSRRAEKQPCLLKVAYHSYANNRMSQSYSEQKNRATRAKRGKTSVSHVKIGCDFAVDWVKIHDARAL